MNNSFNTVINRLEQIYKKIVGLFTSTSNIETNIATIETNVSNIDTNVAAISTYVDELEGFTDEIEPKLDTLINRADLDTWDKIAGNSKEFTYYSGVTPENPSGNKNVESILFKTGVTTILTQSFTYDSEDDVITITAT